MKTISLKLNTYARSVNVISSDLNRLALKAILGSFGVLSILYILFLANMVMNIVERKALETNARDLSTEVNSLELTYLSLSNNIDLTLSYSMGFKETKANFATRKSLGYISADGSAGSNIKIAQNDL